MNGPSGRFWRLPNRFGKISEWEKAQQMYRFDNRLTMPDRANAGSQYPKVIVVLLKLMINGGKRRTPLQVYFTWEVKMLHGFIQIYLHGKDDKHYRQYSPDFGHGRQRYTDISGSGNSRALLSRIYTCSKLCRTFTRIKYSPWGSMDNLPVIC